MQFYKNINIDKPTTIKKFILFSESLTRWLAQVSSPGICCHYLKILNHHILKLWTCLCKKDLCVCVCVCLIHSLTRFACCSCQVRSQCNLSLVNWLGLLPWDSEHFSLSLKSINCVPNFIEYVLELIILDHVWLFMIPWSVVHKVPLSIEFSRKE